MLTNPYVAGNPVGGSNAFVGRSDVLRSVLRVLKNPGENAIVLYGQRRIGKTSVLQELRQTLPNEGAYYPVYFDLQDKAALPLAMVLSELKERIAQEIKLALPKPTNSDPGTDFRETFLPAVLKQLSADASLVLLFDEFDVLDNPGEGQAGKEFFPYLRQLLSFDPRLQFVFVIGRRPEDLSSFTLSIFKGVKSERVSLLTEKDTEHLVRLSEHNNSLKWAEDSVAAVFDLTGGHPFLTQQLCQEIWEGAHEVPGEDAPFIVRDAVYEIISATLQRSTNALQWLWDGLGPAQRIVAAALAEAGPRPIAQEELESQLQKSGVRILVGELQDAPKLLQDWDIIEPVDTNGTLAYRFRVELLRRWIADRKPLRQVQQEIDYVQPAAENLFRAASALYQNGQLAQSIPLLRQAIGLNPNHARGSLLLAEILLAQNEVDEARQLLEALFQYQPPAARPRLTQVLLEQLRITKDDAQRLILLDRILNLDPNQSEARFERLQTWLRQLEVLEKAERYSEAFDLAQQITAELPANHPLLPNLPSLERKTHISNLYQKGVSSYKKSPLVKNERVNAIKYLVEVITLQPTYREATRYLHAAVSGLDSHQLINDLANEKQERQNAEQQLQKSDVRLQSERQQREKLQQQLAEISLQIRLDKMPAWLRFLRRPPAWFSWIAVGLLSWMLYWQISPASTTGNQATPTPTSEIAQGAADSAATQMIIETPDPTRWVATLPANPTIGSLWNHPTFEIALVYVPEGSFKMGSLDTDSAASADEKPQHDVFLDAFWIMQTEVTNVQYAKCVEAGKCSEPNNARWNDSNYANHPVTHVDWNQASAYAAWVGGRLPTEAEWEKAARGTNGRIYPWGNQEPTKQLLNYNSDIGITSVVGKYPEGKSPYAAFDMAGNLWEWTADWYDENYYQSESEWKNPQGPAEGTYRVLRGGSWSNQRAFVRAAYRSGNSPDDRDGYVGFRVMRPLAAMAD